MILEEQTLSTKLRARQKYKLKVVEVSMRLNFKTLFVFNSFILKP